MTIRFYLLAILLDLPCLLLLMTASGRDDKALLAVAIVITALAVLFQIVLMIRVFQGKPPKLLQAKPRPSEADALKKALYADSLVTIYDDEIHFLHYYYPLGRKKVVPFSQIDRIEAKKPTFLNGKWRLWGSGDCQTWFGEDCRRPSRDTIFVAHLNSQSWRVGFTVEDSASVKSILEEKGIAMAGG